MPPAARTTDLTRHGTPLSGGGSPNVFVGGLPAFRASKDVHFCPLTTSGGDPHVGGIVEEGSRTVFVNGAPAARQGDTIPENGPTNAIDEGEPSVIIE